MQQFVLDAILTKAQREQGLSIQVDPEDKMKLDILQYGHKICDVPFNSRILDIQDAICQLPYNRKTDPTLYYCYDCGWVGPLLECRHDWIMISGDIEPEDYCPKCDSNAVEAK